MAGGRDIRPEHVLWALTVASGMATLVSGLGWLLIVGICGYYAWIARTRPILWPPDVEDLLVQYRVTRQTGRPMEEPRATGAPDQPFAYIPFRPLTFGEMFGAAYKIVTRNATTLIGIPLLILGTFVVAMAVLAMVLMQLMTALMEFTVSFEWMGTLLTVFFVVPWLLSLIVAFPADALLIALCVTATDKAVRGESVHLTEVLAAARGRMFAVCRLTAAYYAWFIITEFVVYGVLIAAVLGATPSALVLLVPINIVIFGLGIMFSLAPIALVVERRGVMDSFRRAWDLAKTAWPRLVGIHLLWALCVAPLLTVPMMLVIFTLGWLGAMIAFAVVFAFLLAYFRALQMLIYTDLRIRQERYDVELGEAWSRNTGAAR